MHAPTRGTGGLFTIPYLYSLRRTASVLISEILKYRYVVVVVGSKEGRSMHAHLQATSVWKLF